MATKRVVQQAKEAEGIEVNFGVYPKQKMFIDSTANWVLYGGAAGGGKSHIQVVDAFIWAVRYPGCQQLILRKTFKELERTLILKAQELYPRSFYKYNGSEHKIYFKNPKLVGTGGDEYIGGSIIEFGYCELTKDVYKYMSSEFDCIRIDEASHFEEFAITYLYSRIRGANGYPKQLKLTSNPGNVSHKFLKERFIDGKKPMEVHEIPIETTHKMYSQFIPALVTENTILMEKQPEYISNLEQLPEREREALLHGNWNIATGVAFPEFDYEINTCDDFVVPGHWPKWMSVDNGYTDPFYWGWWTVSPEGIVYQYREYTRTSKDDRITFSEQAKRVREKMRYMAIMDDGREGEIEEKISHIVTGLDAWYTHHRDQQGKTIIDYYNEGGLWGFTKAVTDRRIRKRTFHEYLKPIRDENTGKIYSKVQFFRRACPSIIADLPNLIEDEKKPETVMDCSYDHGFDSGGYSLVSHHFKKAIDPEDDVTGIAAIKKRLERKVAMQKKFKYYR